MWSAIIIWLGFALLAHLLTYPWLIMIVLSVILLSSAIYQHSQGWHTSLSTWVFGIWMAVFSVIELVSELIAGLTGTAGLNVDLGVYLGVALVSMGVAAVFRTMQVGGGQAGAAYSPNRTGRQRAAAAYEGDSRPRGPRRMDTQSNTAYTPPVRGGTSGRRGGRRGSDYRANRDDLFEDSLEDYGYDQPEASGRRRDYNADVPDARTGRQSAYSTGRQQAAQPARQSARSTPARGGRQDDYGYQPEADQYGGPTQRVPGSVHPRRTDDRRRANPAGARRSSRAADEASADLENRVEDIIRRSRERRTQPPEDLPY
jgi:hypothetical protein